MRSKQRTRARPLLAEASPPRVPEAEGSGLVGRRGSVPVAGVPAALGIHRVLHEERHQGKGTAGTCPAGPEGPGRHQSRTRQTNSAGDSRSQHMIQKCVSAQSDPLNTYRPVSVMSSRKNNRLLYGTSNRWAAIQSNTHCYSHRCETHCTQFSVLELLI